MIYGIKNAGQGKNVPGPLVYQGLAGFSVAAVALTALYFGL